MAENECIENLNILVHLWENDENMYSDTLEIEIDQDFMSCIYKSIDALREIQQYRAIGTVEECREARERQIGKKPYLYGGARRGIDNDGNSISKEENCYECPNCDAFLGYEVDCKDENYQVDYCPNCGQAIDFSEV